MNRLVSRTKTLALGGLLACAIGVSTFAGGKSKTCHQCGHDKHVKHVLRLVKVCEEVELPCYIYTKEEVFYPDKGAICYTGYRSDTFYKFWRTCDCFNLDEPSQQSTQHPLSQLNCSSYTVCGCKTMYGAKSTGCHSGCSIRVPGKSQHIATPILKWETVPLCKECCEKRAAR
ncbi:MAG: hypothetical protein H6822_16240 [Planctomycetaceae bacterium]|nr:hypothetical protein [Planctomycetales bacterium]MCB9923731.1 hypothetical protein [Planctomycetaceae bacterium]